MQIFTFAEIDLHDYSNLSCTKTPKPTQRGSYLDTQQPRAKGSSDISFSQDRISHTAEQHQNSCHPSHTSSSKFYEGPPQGQHDS